MVCFTRVRTRAGHTENEICPSLPGAKISKEDDGDVRIARTAIFEKVSKTGQVVLVRKKPEIVLRKAV